MSKLNKIIMWAKGRKKKDNIFNDILHGCINCVGCKYYILEFRCGCSAYCLNLDNQTECENGEFLINNGPDELNGDNQCKYKELEVLEELQMVEED